MNIMKKLKKNRKIDALMGGCNIGPHKSDYLFNFNNEYFSISIIYWTTKNSNFINYLAHCKYL